MEKSFAALLTFSVSCVVQAGQEPLSTPSFNLLNPDGVIDIPTNAFITIDANGPDVLLTAQLTGICSDESGLYYHCHDDAPPSWAPPTHLPLPYDGVQGRIPRISLPSLFCWFS